MHLGFRTPMGVRPAKALGPAKRGAPAACPPGPRTRSLHSRAGLRDSGWSFGVKALSCLGEPPGGGCSVSRLMEKTAGENGTSR